MEEDFKSCDSPLTDKSIFWPAFVIFVALLIGIYVVTSPTGGDMVHAFFRR